MLTDAQLTLVALFTQALLYGIYLATLIQCFRWLLFTDEGWEPRERINFLIVFATIFIFLTSTIYLLTSLKYEINDMTRTEYWYNYGTVMAMNISENLATISIDGVLIHRCWSVYEKSWRVICVPVIFWLASLACSAMQSYYSGLNFKGEIYSLAIAQIGKKSLISLYACNIAITIYSTTAIIYRILSSRKNSNSGRNHKRLNYTMRILAESGGLYTSMIIFSVVGLALVARKDSTWVDSLIAQISDPMAFSTGGISFNLIIIRVYQSRVELHNSFPDSKEDCELSETQLNNPQTTAPSERPSSNALDKTIDETDEHHRSREGTEFGL